MKSKKRHQSSSEDSEEESDASHQTSSTSDSESEASSASEPRHKKKRKRANSSNTESDSDDQKRSKRRKHKKKKKKHGKKKRHSEMRSVSVERSISVEEISISDGDLSSKRRRKHKKHSKRGRDSSASEEEGHTEHRLHSVVKERRASSVEGRENQPSRTYYQRDYRHSGSGEEYDREREVQRFYRGSSRDRSARRHEEAPPYCDRERQDKYSSKEYDRQNDDYYPRPRHYDEYRRHQRYEDRRAPEEHHRPREEYQSRDGQGRGYHNSRYNQYEERGPKRHEYNDGRDYRDRRPHTHAPGQDRYREREYADRKERYQDHNERPREERRDKPPSLFAVRIEKPTELLHPHREPPKPKSPENRYRERTSRPDPRPRPEQREDRDRDAPRYKDGRGDERREERRESYPERSEGRERPRREFGDRPPPPRERRSKFEPEGAKEYGWGKPEVKKEENEGEKEKPNFGLSGKLAAETNTVNGVVIKYSEPDDAKQPKRRWRFYPFKGDKALPILYIHRQSAFLIGRDKKVADIHLEHPSISKQHAALQFRATPFDRPDGSIGRRVRPYIIDLESANGTFVNNKKIEEKRYVELLERDVVKFGFSAREYVLLHENSKDDAQDDDNQEPGLGAAVTTTDQIKHDKRLQQETAEDGE